jgi:hypothetical protein
MTTFKKVLLIVLLIPVVLAVISLFLPSHYRVVRSIQINARPEAVFTNINTLRTWPEWTAWTVTRYPDMKVSFAGPEAGAGATYTWEGKTSGTGLLKLTRSNPDKSVEFDLDFEHGQYVSKGAIVLEPSGDSTKVTWSNEGDLGRNPVSRYAGLFMDKFMGPDFEKGLQNLKQRVEPRSY